MRPTAVVFDMDGTVTDSMPFLAHAIQVIASRISGREFTDQDAVDAFGPPDIEVIENMVGRRISDVEIEQYIGYQRAHAREQVPPIPGMVTLLQSLREAGIVLGIYTARSRVAAEAVLERSGLLEYFDELHAGDQVENVKPAPDGLIDILATLGVPAKDALYVGDTKHDLQVAEGAGVTSVLALWARDPREHLIPEADHHFYDTREFRDWVLG